METSKQTIIPQAKLKIHDEIVDCFIDTGSSICLIKKSLAIHFINKFNLRVRSSNKILKNVSNEIVENNGTINLTVTIKSNKIITHTFFIVEEHSHFSGGALIGTDFLSRNGAIINLGKNQHIKLMGIKHPIHSINKSSPQIYSINDDKINNDKCNGYAIKNECVPSYHAKLITIKINDNNLNNKTIVASSDPSHYQDLIIPRTLSIVKNNQISLVAINNTEYAINIRTNNIICKIELADYETANGGTSNYDVADSEYINKLSTHEESSNDQMNDRMHSFNETDFEKIINDTDLSHLKNDEQLRLTNLLYKYHNAIAVDDDIGRANFTEQEIFIKENEPPIYCAQYRIPYAARKIVDEQVQKLLKQGVIEPSKSPWSAPILLVKKNKSNEYRFCVDFRKLNSIVKKDTFPLPRTDDILEQLKGASIFTTLDFKNSFHQIPLAKGSREYTAFRTISGSYQFQSVPQGLNISSAAFQRACNIAFSRQLGKFMYCYIDDIVIHSESFEEHLQHLEEVLKQIEMCGFKIGINKCQFAKDSVKYLGHIVNRHGIQVDNEKTAAIEKCDRPRTAKQARSFLGAAGYYRKFIRNFAGIAAPLTNLTKKNQRFKWTPECQRAFQELKEKLISAPVLAYPDNQKPYTIHTDASDNAVGAVLNQYNESTNSEQPIAYFSRKLKETELKYSVSEKEALAIYEAVKYFKPYVWLQTFKIITDHSALKFLLKNKNTVPRISRWALFLSDFDYEIEYKQGKSHFVPDYLSRSTEQQETIFALHVDDSPEDTLQLDKETIQREQSADPSLRLIISYIKDATGKPPKTDRTSSLDEFFIEDDILYRIPRLRNKFTKVSQQTVIPKSLIKSALKYIHDSDIAAHQGFLRSLHRARDNFFWTNMIRDVKEYVKCCMQCQKRKWQGRETGELGEFPEINFPLDRIGVDLIELPTSYNGNKYALTIIDAFTKYVSAYALPNKNAETITQAMTEYICENSVPKEIVADRGSEFINDLFKRTCELLNSKNRYTTAYHPMANGLTEKTNSTIKKALSNLCENDKFTWDAQLKFATLAINTAVQTSINEIPFFLFHGRDARLPFNNIINTQAPINYAEEDFKVEMSLRLHKAFQQVKEFAKIAKEKSAKYYNRKATKCLITEGDMVLLSNDTHKTENPTAWPTKFIGPYRVLSRKKNNFTIRGIYADTKVQTVHINRLKLAHLLPNNAYPFNNAERREHEITEPNAGTMNVVPQNQHVEPAREISEEAPQSTTEQEKQHAEKGIEKRYNLRKRR